VRGPQQQWAGELKPRLSRPKHRRFDVAGDPKQPLAEALALHAKLRLQDRCTRTTGGGSPARVQHHRSITTPGPQAPRGAHHQPRIATRSGRVGHGGTEADMPHPSLQYGCGRYRVRQLPINRVDGGRASTVPNGELVRRPFVMASRATLRETPQRDREWSGQGLRLSAQRISGATSLASRPPHRPRNARRQRRSPAGASDFSRSTPTQGSSEGRLAQASYRRLAPPSRVTGPQGAEYDARSSATDAPT
jgi:hypothetical protein